MIGELSALGAAVLWSSSSFLFTEASIRIGPIQLNVDRMIVAALLLLITVPLFGFSFMMSYEQIFLLTVSGFAGLVIGDTYLFRAFKEIGPRVTMLIMSLNPAIAAILAYFILSESLSFWGISGIVITIAGVLIVVRERAPATAKSFSITKAGIFYAFMAAAGQGTGLIFAKQAYLIGDLEALPATFIRIVSAVIILMPLAKVFRRYLNPVKLYTKDSKSLKMVFIGSIIGPYLGITFSYIAVANTLVGIASTLMATVPIIMLPIAKFYYKETLTPTSILGALVAVAGVAILFLV